MGMVLDIQRFCIHDGPGIRTTVFLKGCPLNCIWCHNPESISPEPQIGYIKSKCIHCGNCETGCPTGARRLYGAEKTAQEVMKEVFKDKIYYDASGGGVTISGGEPMFQPEFTLELLTAAKKAGLNTAVETCGFADFTDFAKILSYTDLFLYDYKTTENELHKEFTGCGNELILDNLEKLTKMGAKIILRCPIIPGYNDTKNHREKIDELKKNYTVEIMPYHSFGNSKREQLSLSPTCEDI